MLIFFSSVNNFLLQKHQKRPGSLTTVSFRQFNGDIYSQEKYSNDIIINFIIHFIIFPHTTLLHNPLFSLAYIVLICLFFVASFNLYVTHRYWCSRQIFVLLPHFLVFRVCPSLFTMPGEGWGSNMHQTRGEGKESIWIPTCTASTV